MRNISKRQLLNLKHRFRLDDYELLLYKCGVTLKAQIEMFGCRLRDRGYPLDLGEFQILLGWLQQDRIVDPPSASWAEEEFIRINLSQRSAPAARVA